MAASAVQKKAGGECSPVVRFETIWQNYPKTDPCVDPKTGAYPPGYENQCAIRVGYALEKSGVSFANFKGGRCPVGMFGRGGMTASAQELANWLGRRPFCGCPNFEKYTGGTALDAIKDRTGIIFFSDYWQRANEKGTPKRTGDHIDLWNGSRLTAYSSWFRLHLGISYDGLWSNYLRSPTVLFWNLQ